MNVLWSMINFRSLTLKMAGNVFFTFVWMFSPGKQSYINISVKWIRLLDSTKHMSNSGFYFNILGTVFKSYWKKTSNKPVVYVCCKHDFRLSRSFYSKHTCYLQTFIFKYEQNIALEYVSFIISTLHAIWPRKRC